MPLRGYQVFSCLKTVEIPGRPSTRFGSSQHYNLALSEEGMILYAGSNGSDVYWLGYSGVWQQPQRLSEVQKIVCNNFP
jgi:hypothetical protein